jgi:hypothetical protein
MCGSHGMNDIRTSTVSIRADAVMCANLDGALPLMSNYVFDAAQHCVVSIEKALIDKAIEATRKVVETEEAKQRLLELALYDAQMAVMSIAGELLHHAYCRDDEQAVELLRAWAPDRVWKFLDLSAAIQAESQVRWPFQARPRSHRRSEYQPHRPIRRFDQLVRRPS